MTSSDHRSRRSTTLPWRSGRRFTRTASPTRGAWRRAARFGDFTRFTSTPMRSRRRSTSSCSTNGSCRDWYSAIGGKLFDEDQSVDPGDRYACVCSAGLAPRPASAQTQEGDSLRSLPPANVRVISEMRTDRRSFTNYLFWDDLSKALSTLVHDPDTTGWHPAGSSDLRRARFRSCRVDRDFAYTGTIDRTLTFSRRRGARPAGRRRNHERAGVQPECPYHVQRRRREGGTHRVRSTWDRGTRPGSRSESVSIPARVDLGFTAQSSPRATSTATPLSGSGSRTSRGTTCSAGRAATGAISSTSGRSPRKMRSSARSSIRCTSRRSSPRFVRRASTRVSGRRSISARSIRSGRLGENELFWLDSNAFNGFTYYYLVTTYDRGYNVNSTSQGLSKFDHCPVTEGVPYPCPSELVSVETRGRSAGESPGDLRRAQSLSVGFVAVHDGELPQLPGQQAPVRQRSRVVRI